MGLNQRIEHENPFVMYLCFLTYPYSLHLGAEGKEQLKQDQPQGVDVHFVRVGVPRELQGEQHILASKIHR